MSAQERKVRHGPGEASRLAYPGGKDGWYRVPCIHPYCDYEAREALEQRAIKRVEDHAEAKNSQSYMPIFWGERDGR